MKIKSAPKNGGVLIEPKPEENQASGLSTATSAAFKLKTILVPVDFSDCSKKALQYAIAFAKQFGAQLRLLHVVEPYPAFSELAVINIETNEQGKANLQTLQQSIDPGIHCEISVRDGSPAVEIADTARELSADLIIMSTHGRKGITRMMLGSTTEQLVRHAPCPVLIVRESERDFVPKTSVEPEVE